MSFDSGYIPIAFIAAPGTPVLRSLNPALHTHYQPNSNPSFHTKNAVAPQLQIITTSEKVWSAFQTRHRTQKTQTCFSDLMSLKCHLQYGESQHIYFPYLQACLLPGSTFYCHNNNIRFQFYLV